MIIATIVPNNYFAPWDFVKSILSLPPKYSYFSVESPSLPDNRNRVWNYAKKHNDDLLLIDSDIVFKPEDVQKIEEYLTLLDAVTGVYCLGRPPYKAAIFDRTENDYELINPREGLTEIGACGAGFLGISKRTFDKMPDNPFSNVWEGDTQHGEDVSFCYNLMKNGFKLWCDSTINVGQIRTVQKYYNRV